MGIYNHSSTPQDGSREESISWTAADGWPSSDTTPRRPDRRLGGVYYFTKTDLHGDSRKRYQIVTCVSEEAHAEHLSWLSATDTNTPYGITLIASYFQEIMDYLTSDLHGEWSTWTIYLSAMPRPMNTFRNYVIYCSQCLQDNGLCCNLKGSSFANLSTKCLGHAHDVTWQPIKGRKAHITQGTQARKAVKWSPKCWTPASSMSMSIQGDLYVASTQGS